jgi:hypothetical protein
MNIRIVKKRLLLVEGKDELNFFTALLNTLNIDTVQIIDIGGKQQLHSKFQALINMDGFEHVEKYAIIQDADDDYQATFQSITGLLRKLNQPSPQEICQFVSNDKVAVGIYIFPRKEHNGMLEDLCLASIDNNFLTCIDEYLSCIEQFTTIKNKPKARLYSYLSVNAKNTLSLGVAAMQGVFDLNNESFLELKEFLENLR